jgi:hypothetical protein
VVVTGGVLWLLVRVLTECPRKGRLTFPILLLTGLLVLQLCLGTASYMAKMAAANDPQPLSPFIEISAAHVGMGARARVKYGGHAPGFPERRGVHVSPWTARPRCKNSIGVVAFPPRDLVIN